MEQTNSGIKLIALDLDNTALNNQKQMTPRVRAAIQNAIAAGINVIPATCRILEGVPRAFTSIPGVHYILAANGAAVQ